MLKLSRSIILTLHCCLLFYSQADTAEANPTGSNPDVEAWLEEVLPAMMAEHRVPGAVFVLTNSEQVIASRGFGYANLEEKIPVEPDITVFRAASVGKVIAVVAALQDRGLDLDSPVNGYLGNIQVENPFSNPLLVRHLLTHTDGFQERLLGVGALTGEQIPPLSEVIRRELKPTVLNPGTFVSYGSWGTAITAYLVERRSGLDFADYANTHIFEPLGMNHTTFLQGDAMPPSIANDLAPVYRLEGDEIIRTPNVLVTTPASGGISTSAGDMGRLLMTLLNDGVYGGRRLLSADDAHRMLSVQARPVVDFPGVSFGFLEFYINGEKVLIRDGSGAGVRARLLVIPKRGLGFFYAQNTRGDELAEELTHEFMDRFFPPTPDNPMVDPPSIKPSRSYAVLAGEYVYSQRPRFMIDKIAALFVGRVIVEDKGDRLTISPLGMMEPYGGFEKTREFYEIRPLVFKAGGEDFYAAFVEDQHRNVRLLSGNAYHSTFDKSSFLESRGFLFGSGIFLILASAAGVLFWFYQRSRASAVGQGAGRIAVLVSLCNSAFFVLFLVYNTRELAGFPMFAFTRSISATPLLWMTATLPLLSLLLTATLVTIIIVRTYQGEVAGSTIGYCSAVAFVSVLFLVYVNYWNYLGYHF